MRAAARFCGPRQRRAAAPRARPRGTPLPPPFRHNCPLVRTVYPSDCSRPVLCGGEGGRSDPATGQPLTSAALIPNKILKHAIADFPDWRATALSPHLFPHAAVLALRSPRSFPFMPRLSPSLSPSLR